MISLVVATYNDEEGCYLSAFAAKAQLDKSNLEYEIIIVADAGTTTKWEHIPNFRCLRLTGNSRSGSPQGTRDAGIRASKFRNVCVIESHVILSDIVHFVEEHIRVKSSLSFCPRIGEGPEMFSVFGSETDWDGSLWYKRHLYAGCSPKPFQTAQFGHSSLVVDRDFYIANGGYTNLLKGWGHEEQHLCLRTWMLGGTCWMIPTVWQAHFLSVGAHADSLASEQFEKNAKIVKFVLTGERNNLFLTPEILAERNRICQGPFGGDIQKLRNYFKEHGVLN